MWVACVHGGCGSGHHIMKPRQRDFGDEGVPICSQQRLNNTKAKANAPKQHEVSLALIVFGGLGCQHGGLGWVSLCMALLASSLPLLYGINGSTLRTGAKKHVVGNGQGCACGLQRGHKVHPPHPHPLSCRYLPTVNSRMDGCFHSSYFFLGACALGVGGRRTRLLSVSSVGIPLTVSNKNSCVLLLAGGGRAQVVLEVSDVVLAAGPLGLSGTKIKRHGHY